MTQKRNKIISALLCAALLFTGAGCSQAPASGGSQSAGLAATGTPQGAMGRWVEEKIDLGKPYQLLTAPNELADGTLRLYARDVMDESATSPQNMPIYQIDSTDGGVTWQETPTTVNETECNLISDIAMSPNGGVLLLGLLIGEERSNQQFGVYYTAPGGTPQPILFDGASPLLQTDETHPEGFSSMSTGAKPLFEGQPQINSFGFLSDTLAYACITPTFDTETQTESGIDVTILFDPTTGNILSKVDAGKGYSSGSLGCVGAYSGGLMHTTYDSESAARTFYSVDTSGNSTLRIEGLSVGNSTQTAFADEQGNYYFINNSGIYRIAVGGTLAELVVDSTGFAFSSENSIVWDQCFTYTSDGSFYVALMPSNSMESTLYHYRFDKTLPSVNEKSIQVWSLRDNATLRAGIVMFNQANSDITVIYNVGMPSDAEGLNPEDVLRALNTQILAGTGPDVLVLDDIDASAYASKGLLSDLSAQVDGNALVPFVKNVYYKPGETFVLPARFSVPVLVGPTEKMDAITSLNALRDAVLACAPRPVMDGASDNYYTPLPDDEMYALGFYSVAQLTQFALQTSASALLKDGKVDTAALTQLLGFIEAVGKHSSMGEYPPSFASNGAVGGGGEACEWLDGGYEFSFTGNAVYAWDLMHTPSYLANIRQESHDTQETRALKATVQPGLVPGAYVPRTMLAVSAGSKQQETALTFVKTMLNTEVQQGFYQDGMPVLQAELDASIARNCEPKWLKKSKMETQPVAFFENLQTPVVIDTQVQQSVADHAQMLVAGTETLEQAVAGVEQELALYLAERG